MYLDFQVKNCASNFRHHCFFTSMAEIVLAHITGITISKHLNYFTNFQNFCNLEFDSLNYAAVQSEVYICIINKYK